MTDDPSYATEVVAATPAMRARISEAAEAEARGASGMLGSLAGVAILVFGAIGLIDLLFGVVDAASWLVLSVGAAILLVPTVLIHLRGAREGQADRDAAAADLRAQAEAGEVVRHTLRRDARHWFVEHEHGVMHLCPADAGRTLYLDLSSVSGDERHDRWYAKGRIDHDRWTWVTTPHGRVLLDFEAHGAPLPASSLERSTARYDPQVGAALFRYLGSPEDGDLIDKPFARIDAWIRRRIAKAKPD